MKRVGGWFWILFCAGFAGFGVYLAAQQHRKTTRFLPVEATVLSADVESHRSTSYSSSSGRRETTVSYRPVVHYRYKVDGATYYSDSVVPLDVGRGGAWGRRWARGVVRQFEKGQQTRAYYNPQEPAEAFLLKQATTFPYMFILLPTILGTVGLAFFRSSKEPLPAPAKRRWALCIAAAWYGVGLLCAGHYFALAGANYDDLALPMFGVFAAVALMPLAYALPEEGIGGRVKVAIFFSVAGAAIGLLAGLFGGLLVGSLTDLIWDKRIGGVSWAWKGAAVGAGLFALLGLFGEKVQARWEPPRNRA